MSIANDLGYYEITDKPGLRFENKIQALQSCNDISQIKWVFQDKQFASINWENEPKEDLYELYRQRAMSLRLKYDRLILYYSGGIDSTCVLHSFIDNNIPLDGIVSYGAFDIKSYESYNRNQEIFRVAQPYIHHLEKTRGIKLPYHLLDDWYLFEQSFKDESWILNTNSASVSPETFIWTKHRQDPYFQQHLMAGTTAVIRGVDKPRVLCEDGTWKVSFLDSNANGLFGSECSTDDPNSLYYEYFYWSGDNPKVICKQGHMIKQYFQKINRPDIVNTLFSRESDKFVSSEYFKWIDPIIYERYLTNKPRDDRNYFSLGKTPLVNAWHKDDVFFEHASKSARDVWNAGIDHAINTIDTSFFNSAEPTLQSFIKTGLRGIWSRDYNLGS